MEAERRVIALGFFDGVHLGHAALFSRALQRAREHGLTPSALEFDAHPDALVHGETPALICSARDRRALIARLFGITDRVVLHFDRAAMETPWDAYLEKLAEQSGAAWLVAGEDFRFGRGGAGTAERLADWCAGHGLGCDIVPQRRLDGVVVSSTYIRTLLAAGDVARANAFLGHPYTLTDEVRHGAQLGRTIGAPTINLGYEAGVLCPRRGVYYVLACLPDGRRCPAVCNVGVRPTVSGAQTVSVESYLLDYAGDLYGKTVTLAFYGFDRPEQQFSDLAALQAAIARSAEAARRFFGALAHGTAAARPDGRL